MGKPDRKPKEPEEDLDIKATLHKLLQNTKGIPEMNAEVTGLKTQLKRTNDVLIPGLQTQIAALKTDVKEMSGDIEVQDSRLKDLEDRFEKLENENKLLQEELVKVKGQPSKPPTTLDDTQIEDKVQTLLRRQERLTHLLIDGVCENPNENVLEQVGLILYDTQLNLDRNSIRKVYRLGVLNEKNWRPRPIVVEFDTRETRDQVFRARYNIKTNPNCANVWINERLDDEQRTQRMEMRALADLAKEQQREARVVGDTLIVSGIKYKHADIYKLPDDISLEMAFTRTDGEYIFFNSEHSFLSAFYPVDFEYKKQDYQSAEQAHAHRKAKDNGHHDIAKLILKEKDPRKCKQLAKGLSTTQTWRDDETEEIKAIQEVKFNIPVLKNKLIETGNATLVECTGDKRWGCGCPYNSKLRRERNWPGKNKFGETLMERRVALAAEQTTSEANSDTASHTSTENDNNEQDTQGN